MSDRPNLGDALSNWKQSELPLAEKLRLAVKNNAIKVLKRSDCCGNHGEPGC